MNKEFSPFPEAFELKQLGFDEPCFGYYDLDGLQISRHHWYPENKNSSFPLPDTTNNPKISAPTFAQAFRWFRDKHNIDSWVQPFVMQSEIGRIYLPDETYSYYIFKDGEFVSNEADFNEPEEAELDCLRKLIAIVKEEQQPKKIV